MDPTPLRAPTPSAPNRSSASPAVAAQKFNRGDAAVLLGLLAVWGGAAWLTHCIFSVGWGWSIGLGPVLLVLLFIYSLGTQDGAVLGGKKLAAMFQRPGPPRS